MNPQQIAMLQMLLQQAGNQGNGQGMGMGLARGGGMGSTPPGGGYGTGGINGAPRGLPGTPRGGQLMPPGVPNMLGNFHRGMWYDRRNNMVARSPSEEQDPVSQNDPSFEYVDPRNVPTDRFTSRVDPYIFDRPARGQADLMPGPGVGTSTGMSGRVQDQRTPEQRRYNRLPTGMKPEAMTPAEIPVLFNPGTDANAARQYDKRRDRSDRLENLNAQRRSMERRDRASATRRGQRGTTSPGRNS